MFRFRAVLLSMVQQHKIGIADQIALNSLHQTISIGVSPVGDDSPGWYSIILIVFIATYINTPTLEAGYWQY